MYNQIFLLSMYVCICMYVQRKLRPRLLYIIRKLLSRRCVAENKILTFLKSQFTIYIKPLQRTLHSSVTFASKCNNPIINVISVSVNSNRHQKLHPRTVIVQGGTCNGYCPMQIFIIYFCLC